MHRLLNLFLVLIVLFSFDLKAKQNIPIDFYTYRYDVEQNDTFDSILALFLRPDLTVRSWTLMVQETRARNPQIDEWDNLKEGQTIILFLDPRHIAWDELCFGFRCE